MGLYEDHAALYDLAFDWDTSEEVTWLLARLGSECRSVLEPGCGPGRHLAALAARGRGVTGLDRSPAMVDLARRRLTESRLPGRVTVADMCDFDLGRRFDGAICPVNTLAHLSPEQLQCHLQRIGDHLRDGGRYLVQLDQRAAGGEDAADSRTWEAARGDLAVRITWSVEDVDVSARRERHRARLEVLSGEQAGMVVEDSFAMIVWTPEAWTAALARSAFERVAVYDGDRPDRPRVAAYCAGALLWHELVRRPRRATAATTER